jgi:hypothetical protein
MFKNHLVFPKIALLVSGHTRSIRHTVNNITELKQMLSCDVFIHYWTTQEMNTASWRNPEKYEREDISCDVIENLLKPKVSNVEDAECVSANVFPVIYSQPRSTGFIGSHYMIYGMWKCFKLCQDYSRSSGKKYDVVIRYRYDLICVEPHRLVVDVLEVFADKKIVKMPDHNWATSVGAFFDGVIVANFETYLSTILSLPIYFANRIDGLKTPLMVFPELFIVESIQKSGAKVKCSKSEFQLIRKNGKAEQKFKQNRGLINEYISLYRVYKYVRSLLGKDPENAIKLNWGVTIRRKYRVLFSMLFAIDRSIRRSGTRGKA